MQDPGPRPLGCAITGLLLQFALRTKLKVLCGVALARRKLDHHLADGVAELALQHHPQFTRSVFKQRNNHDGAGVHDIFTVGVAAIGQPDRVAKGMQQTTLEQLLAGEPLLDQMLIIHANFWEFNAQL